MNDLILKIKQRIIFIDTWVENLFYSKNGIIVNTFMTVLCGRVLHKNFGDDLNYFIIKWLTGKHILKYDKDINKNKPNLMAIGSIIEWMAYPYSIIWGSGAMYGGNHPFSHLKSEEKGSVQVKAVRGPLTRQYLISHGLFCPEIYGDPALLLPLMYYPELNKKIFRVGFILNSADYRNDYVQSFINKNPNNSVIINISDYKSIESVIDQIVSCEIILSSSLHGLILADAYNVPNHWIKLSNNVSGGEFKYHDYLLSVGKDYNPFICKRELTEEDLKNMLLQYRPINYDPQPLINAFPFKIEIKIPKQDIRIPLTKSLFQKK